METPAGISRTVLLYYDTIGLLKPSGRTGAGYRIYSEADVQRLKQIMIYRDADKWHAIFEKNSPEQHHPFLETLGLTEEEIKLFRESFFKRNTNHFPK